jgi:intracellular multiplication protein IcmB
MKTKHGRVMQLLTMTIGPIELWAYSTTAEDAALRNRLYDLMGDAARARRVLAARYPGGTAKSDIEKLKSSMVADEGGVIERLAQELAKGRASVTA